MHDEQNTLGVQGASSDSSQKPLLPENTILKSGGHIVGSKQQPAFYLRQNEALPLPIVIAVPHAGRHYPRNLLGQMRFPSQCPLRLEDRLIDLVGDVVARQTGAVFLKAHAPRAMIDLNRALDDMDWSMVASSEGARLMQENVSQHKGMRRAGQRARSGLGLVPRRLSGMGELWRRQMSADELEARIEGVHKPYHTMLGQVLEAMRDKWGTALLIDLHSMPPLGPKSQFSAARDASAGREAELGADFVVGDRYGASCDSALSSLVLSHLDQCGSRVAHNRPYAGGYVLDRHSMPGRDIHALQLEVCRATYLDAQLSEPGSGLDDIISKLTGLVRRLADEMGGRHAFLQAAE